MTQSGPVPLSKKLQRDKLTSASPKNCKTQTQSWVCTTTSKAQRVHSERNRFWSRSERKITDRPTTNRQIILLVRNTNLSTTRKNKCAIFRLKSSLKTGRCLWRRSIKSRELLHITASSLLPLWLRALCRRSCVLFKIWGLRWARMP